MTALNALDFHTTANLNDVDCYFSREKARLQQLSSS